MVFRVILILLREFNCFSSYTWLGLAGSGWAWPGLAGSVQSVPKMCGKFVGNVWNMCGKCVGARDTFRNVWKMCGLYVTLSTHFCDAFSTDFPRIF